MKAIKAFMLILPLVIAVSLPPTLASPQLHNFSYSLTIGGSKNYNYVRFRINFTKEIKFANFLTLENELIEVKAVNYGKTASMEFSSLLYFNPTYLVSLPLLSAFEKVKCNLEARGKGNMYGHVSIYAPRLVEVVANYSFIRNSIEIEGYARVWYNPLTGLTRESIAALISYLPHYVKLVNMFLYKVSKSGSYLSSLNVEGVRYGRVYATLNFKVAITSPIFGALSNLNLRGTEMNLLIDLVKGYSRFSFRLILRYPKVTVTTANLSPPLP